MSEPVVFLDTETTGLDPELHEVWEIALIDADGQESVYRPVPEHMNRADSGSIRLVRFYERTGAPDWDGWQKRDYVAAEVARRTAGLHIVASVPAFDAGFLAAFLRQHNLREAWHYHLIDVEALAAGKLGLVPPWDSEALSNAVGVDPSQFDRHTALGDARWAQAIYRAVLP